MFSDPISLNLRSFCTGFAGMHLAGLCAKAVVKMTAVDGLGDWHFKKLREKSLNSQKVFI